MCVNSDVPSAESPTLLILDFDSTLTTTNTLPQFLSILGPESAQNLSKSWAADLKEFEALQTKRAGSDEKPLVFGEDSCRKKDKARSSRLHEGTKAEKLFPRLDSAREVEARSFVRGQKAFSVFTSKERPLKGDLKALIRAHADMCIRNGSVQLRPGWEILLDAAVRESGKLQLSVLSVGWSSVWIHACIAAGWAHYLRDIEAKNSGSSSSIEKNTLMPDSERSLMGHNDGDGNLFEFVEQVVHVQCNDVSSPGPDSNSLSSGLFTASDKLNIMNSMIEAWQVPQASRPSHTRATSLGWTATGDVDNKIPPLSARQSGRVVYFGDSPTDIPCLLSLSTSIGICMRDSSSPLLLPSLIGRVEEGREVEGKTEQDELYWLLVQELDVEVAHVNGLSSSVISSRCHRERQMKEVDDGNDREPGNRNERRIGKVYWARDFTEVFNSGILS